MYSFHFLSYGIIVIQLYKPFIFGLWVGSFLLGTCICRHSELLLVRVFQEILYYLMVNAFFHGIWFSLQLNCEFFEVTYALKRRLSTGKGEIWCVSFFIPFMFVWKSIIEKKKSLKSMTTAQNCVSHFHTACLCSLMYMYYVPIPMYSACDL